MIDYVWDYGTLHRNDERIYIKEMVKRTVKDYLLLENLQDKIVQLLIMSQNFTRMIQGNEWCVSLRDVHRCQTLILNFIEILQQKSIFPLEGKISNEKANIDEKLCTSAIVLALAHCYQSRFSKSEQRENYWKESAKILFNSSNHFAELVKISYKRANGFSQPHGDTSRNC